MTYPHWDMDTERDLWYNRVTSWGEEKFIPNFPPQQLMGDLS